MINFSIFFNVIWFHEDKYASETSDESQIKDFKSEILYLEELQKCPATVPQLLKLTKQYNITNYLKKKR